MSDHISGPSALAEPIADITDVYAFSSPQRPGHLVVVMNTLPFAKIPVASASGRQRPSSRAVRTRSRRCTFERGGLGEDPAGRRLREVVVVDRIADIWGSRTPHPRGTVWPARVDEFVDPSVPVDEVDRWVRSACVLCSNGCGCEIAVKDGAMVGIRGVATDVVNHGRLGPKGLYGSWPWASSPDRLTRPLVRQGGELVETDWATAMGRIVERSKRELADRGPLSHGFYSTGQIFIEEYYTLGVIGKAGVHTPHMDGNTRLCTATAAAAMKESFGCDGQPGSYTDIDHCDAIFLWGHNMAETQTVLWMRVLDRTFGDDPPRIVCVDPRRTPVAAEAERTGGVHLAPRVGTNLALVNGITRELFVNGWVDDDWVADTRLAVTGCARPSTRTRPRRSPGSATSKRATCDGRRRSSAPATGCCRPCCRASTSRTRPRRRRWG